MKLVIVGTGAMGRVLRDCAMEEGTFETVYMVEPLEGNWPEEKPDLLIDFSHPEAIGTIYEYCRRMGGNIPVVLATTGYKQEHELMIGLLEKICPVDRSTNYSQGVGAMAKLCGLAEELLGNRCDIRLTEVHHTKKKDAPSGTAKTLCRILGVNPEEGDQVKSIRMGNVYGEHTVYFAMEDEVLEIKHTAFSKKIFAIGALEAGKMLMKR